LHDKSVPKKLPLGKSSKPLWGKVSFLIHPLTLPTWNQEDPLNKVFLPNTNGRCALEILPLLPREGLSREFVAAVLMSPPVVSYAAQHSTGGRMPRADMRKLLEFEVPVPGTVDACNQLGTELNSRMCKCVTVQTIAARQLAAVSTLQSATLREFFNLS
jgi:hypothetical protein